MKQYTQYERFRDYADNVRGRTETINAANTVFAKHAQASIVEEGVTPAIFPGHHIYVMLKVKSKTENSTLNIDRKRHLELLGELTIGVRAIVRESDGALLEAQGPVVHCFVPDSSGAVGVALEVITNIGIFTQTVFMRHYGEEVEKIIIAQGHGDSLFVNSLSESRDHSIVSIAPSANYSAKELWKNEKTSLHGDVFLVGKNSDVQRTNLSSLLTGKKVDSKQFDVNFSNTRGMVKISAANASLPDSNSPESPTLDEPHESYSISFRADMDGFTAKVANAFKQGHEVVYQVGELFYDVMSQARNFSREYDLVQMPWAGDCFNALIMYDCNDRVSYQEARKNKIIEIAVEFETYMKRKFPDINWAFSTAGGELENAQKCNLLVARLDLDGINLLVSAGKPVVRSLRGLISESPNAGRGVIWKEDATMLEENYRQILNKSYGGENFRHYSLADARKAAAKEASHARTPVYSSAAAQTTGSIMTPKTRPYSNLK
jgi:hypothetical protein